MTAPDFLARFAEASDDFIADSPRGSRLTRPIVVTKDVRGLQTRPLDTVVGSPSSPEFPPVQSPLFVIPSSHIAKRQKILSTASLAHKTAETMNMSSFAVGSGGGDASSAQNQNHAAVAALMAMRKDSRSGIGRALSITASTPQPNVSTPTTPTSFNGPLKKRPNNFSAMSMGGGGIGGTGFSLGSLFRTPNSLPPSSLSSTNSAGAAEHSNSSGSSSGSSSTNGVDRNIKEIKKSLTLDFTSPESAKKTLQTPDVIRFLQLTSPELERFLKQGTRMTTAAAAHGGAVASPVGAASTVKRSHGQSSLSFSAGMPPAAGSAATASGAAFYPNSHQSYCASFGSPVEARTPGGGFAGAASDLLRSALASGGVMGAGGGTTAPITMSPAEFYSYYLQPRGVAEVTTPTPTQFLFPKDVTDKQRQYAQGFIDALNHLHTMNGFVPPQTNLLQSPGFGVSPTGDRSRSEEETRTTPPSVSVIAPPTRPPQSPTTAHHVAGSASTLTVFPSNSTVTVSPTSAFAPPFPKGIRPTVGSGGAVFSPTSPGQHARIGGGLSSPTTDTAPRHVASVIMPTVHGIGTGLTADVNGGSSSCSGGLFPPNMPTDTVAAAAAAASAAMMASVSAGAMTRSHDAGAISAAMQTIQHTLNTAASTYRHQQQQQQQQQHHQGASTSTTFYDRGGSSAYNGRGGAATGGTGTASLEYGGLRIPTTTTVPAADACRQQSQHAVYMDANRQHRHDLPPGGGVVKQEEAQLPSMYDGESSMSSIASSSAATTSAVSLNLVDQEMAKLERKRARNRTAATKCRKRKMERIEQLELEVKQEQTEREEREQKITELAAVVSHYQRLVDLHRRHDCEVDTVRLPSSHMQSQQTSTTKAAPPPHLATSSSAPKAVASSS